MLIDLSTPRPNSTVPDAGAERTSAAYPHAVRPRVLHIGKYYPPYKGGMESHLEVVCSQLKDKVDLKVLVSNTDRNTVRELVDGVEVTRVGKLFDISTAPVCPKLVR